VKQKIQQNSKKNKKRERRKLKSVMNTLTEGNTALGASSPAYPALQVCEPKSITIAETSSANSTK
jgi:hypothetical protein